MEYILYADYAVLFSPDPNVLQLNLDKICTWCDGNLLELNVKKSKWMMMIGQYRHSMAGEVIIYLKDTRMERVKTFNYLGLTIDTNLDFKEHCSTIRSVCGGGWFENPWVFSRALPLLRLARAKIRSNDDWLIGD